MNVEPLPPGLLAGLRRAVAYPDDPDAGSGVQEIQTHISHVFLTRTRVYKLRKAVDLGFVAFGQRAERNADCEREVRLNRRFAPDVYLGIAPVQSQGGRVWLGPPAEQLAPADASGERPEHCVVMRRLPEGRDALSLLERGGLRGRHVDAMAESIARFHQANRLGTPAPFETREWLARQADPVEANFAVLEKAGGESVSAKTLARVIDAARATLRDRRACFERRRCAGLAVDGHGDLHLQHVWFERDDSPPLIIDCVEFREDLRRIDAASDIAFLAMDLGYRGRVQLAERLLRVYARETDDYELYAVIDYYRSYRAGVRAKVAALSAADPSIPTAQRQDARASARRHLALAGRALAGLGRSRLVVVCGVVGSGKSSVAEVLAERLRGAVISSDRVRKRAAGLAPTDRVTGAARRDLYSEARSAEVYAGLLERAAPVLDSGRAAILDATYARAEGRARAQEFAAARGVPVLLVEVRCDEPTALARLERRRRRGDDPSDAGPDLYHESVAGFEPVVGWPREAHLVVDTGASGWRTRLGRALQGGKRRS
jgi:aminoglycoside phosphotransferase family enzyme/predicted kinase